MTNKPILIIGKHGKTGSRVVQRLQSMGLQTRAVSRSTALPFDWQQRETWGPALQGVAAVYVTYQPDLAIPQARADIEAFTAMANEAGVEQIVLLSGRGEVGARQAEEIVINSGISWNIVRASWFFQNFSESFMIDGILQGELILPAGDTPEPFIDAEDIADVVVACLTDAKHHNRLYEVTGPRAMTFADCMAELSQLLQRPVKYTQVPVEAYLAALQQQGVPEPMQWLLKELFTEVLDGRNSQVQPGVEEALARPATDFQVYLKRMVDSGCWSDERVEQAV
ncbi:MAG: NAD(P)H-binding protein [Candidatus Thiodiazotropha weberae]|uniref:NmrA family transcriptional regulator n=1 Tax=Candidatus Thiodiazotropha endoloripes TaxID=1818881 RepID=A0A1E2UQ79_9GAMM|nr:NAD(P)H-binding protein [Candidatus Thiodiazotropha endoloripes]MCG7897601.1 NAD(P)H-binding protein [Candidatus Thiodiazotropha weberae]MCG7900817.1 NAD(P)H-binding protein [Candidatus Thiodiazotropha weberae]MCG7914839.1 NAD(P)H-binding protein [Candidatus Thiodiazotropha weberae]ODB85389.1 NmrA family transcriptional regulator [Candidatus Thiodiazotropha endoloripes]ODB96890.1 NmrA family transcriptional regulator [Candidatus Thiodiazotropha endoloripes]